jgi:hypothetical protein
MSPSNDLIIYNISFFVSVVETFNEEYLYLENFFGMGESWSVIANIF